MGLFTPDMAFEEIVKRQIKKLLQPCLKCVDMVSTELGAVIQKCAEGVSGSECAGPELLAMVLCLSLQMAKYPRLRDETERILSTQLREQEQACKAHVSSTLSLSLSLLLPPSLSSQLKLMIEIELAYMNTNHPDFIGFDRASKNKQGGARAASNQLIRKGWLSIPVSLIKGSTREFWFVLSSDSLTWYKDNEVSPIPVHRVSIPPFLMFPFSHSQEKELKYSMRLEDMRVKDIETGRFSIGKKHVFALFYTTGK